MSIHGTPEPIPETPPRIEQLVFAGRYLTDLRVRTTPFGKAADWTIEDLDADKPRIVASGTSAFDQSLPLSIHTAVLAQLIVERAWREMPIAAMMGLLP